MRNQEGIKTELQKKVHRRISVRGHHFFDSTPSFLCYFLLLSPPPPKDFVSPSAVLAMALH